MSNVLEIDDDGHLRVLRLNRPERKNALNGPLFGGLAQAFRDAARDDDVWVVAVTGNGDGFCSGLDLTADESDEAAPPPAERAEHDERAERPAGNDPAPSEIMAKIMRVECEKPIIAGVNGVAVGFGVSLAMAADIRIAAPKARFHPGYARVGTSPDGGGSWTVTQALGYERAMRFFLESRPVPADEALRIGMVSEVTESDEAFADRFLDYARQVARVAPIAARHTKRLMGAVTQPDDLEAHLRSEVDLALQGLSSEDGQEAVRAMFARDEPTFRNR